MAQAEIQAAILGRKEEGFAAWQRTARPGQVWLVTDPEAVKRWRAETAPRVVSEYNPFGPEWLRR